MIDPVELIVAAIQQGASDPVILGSIRRVWRDSQVDKPNVIRVLLEDNRRVALEVHVDG